MLGWLRSALTWATIWSRWERLKRVKSGMFSTSVLHTPIRPVTEAP